MEIKLDKRNYRKHNARNKALIRKSLEELGAGRSIVIDKDGTIIGGNGTYEQAKKLNIPVEIIKSDGSKLFAIQRTDISGDDERRKKLALLDNSASDSSEFDVNLLQQDFKVDELSDLGVDIKINDVEVDYTERDESILEYKENVFFKSENWFDIPTLRADMLYDGTIDSVSLGASDILEKDKTYLCLYGSYKLEANAENQVIGFFVDDSRFEVVWNDAVRVLARFHEIQPKAIMTPNFSMWADEPIPYNIMAWYKTQWCGRYWQEAGFKILPTINWGDKKTYDFCFLGIPKNAPVVAMQGRNIKTKQEIKLFLDGYFKAKETINFKKVICYGDKIQKLDELKDEPITYLKSMIELRTQKKSL